MYAKIEDGRHAGVDVTSRLPTGGNLSIDGVYDFAVTEDHLRFFDRASEKKTVGRALDWS